MRKLPSNKWTFIILRIILGGIFLYAGIIKIGNPLAFSDSIASFQILSPGLINIVALSLPSFEILLALMLISGWKWRPALLGIVFLTTIFGLALAQAIFRGLEVDCGCFGPGRPSMIKTWWSFGRDVMLFIAALWLYLKALVAGSCATDLARSHHLQSS